MEIGAKFLNTTNEVEVFISEIENGWVRLSTGNKTHYTDDFQTEVDFNRLVEAGAYEPINN